MFRPCTIGDLVQSGVADIQTGPFGTQLKASEYVSDGVPVINVRNIGYSELRPDKLEFVTEAKAEQLGVHRIQSGDIVFGRKGAVDRHLFVGADQQDWVQGSDCIRLRIDTDDLNPRFVSYALLSEPHKKWMLNQCGNKATMASLNQDVVKRIPLRVPDRTTQDGIVAVLSAYDDLIENNRRRIALLEDAARQLYKEWFVRFRFPGHEHVKVVDGVPEGWEMRPFDSLAEYLNGFAFKPHHLGEAGLPIVKIPELKGGILGKTPRYDGEEVPERYLLESGDLVFSWSGTLAIDFWCDGAAYLNQHLFKVSPIERISAAHLLVAVREAMALFENQSVGATMKHIRRSALSEVKAPLPPAVLYSEFCEIIDVQYREIINLRQQSQGAAQARDLLLPKLMNETITV